MREGQMVSILLALVTSAAPVAAPAQAPRAADSTQIAIVVANAATRTLLENVEVVIGGRERVMRTDYVGEVSFFQRRNTVLKVSIRQTGYAPMDTSIQVGNVDWIHITLLLDTKTQQLPAASVTAEAPVPLSSNLAGYERRKAENKGKYITPEQLRESHDRRLVELIERIPGLRLDAAPGGQVIPLARSGPTSFVKGGNLTPNQASGRDAAAASPGYCEVAVFVDGMFLKDPDLGTFRAPGYAAVEFYTASNIPPEFKRPGTQCGVLLIWTR
jgi:hypothetical protein